MNAASPEPDAELTPEKVDALVAEVDGWFGPLEGRLLYRLAAAADPAGSIVEIGSWHGRSTIWLAAGARSGRGARVVAIDPHSGTSLRETGEDTEPMLRANLERAGVSGQVDVVVSTSAEAAAAWARPVSLLWLDGDHVFEAVKLDLELWEPHLLSGAAVALHDTFVLPGPERAVRRLIIGSRRYADIEYAETTTAARLCGDLDLGGRIRRHVSVARRGLYGIRLRAYDMNTLGYARIRDAFSRSAA
jgi:predicted O-methyltransferase YrrM